MKEIKIVRKNGITKYYLGEKELERFLCLVRAIAEMTSKDIFVNYESGDDKNFSFAYQCGKHTRTVKFYPDNQFSTAVIINKGEGYRPNIDYLDSVEATTLVRAIANDVKAFIKEVNDQDFTEVIHFSDIDSTRPESWEGLEEIEGYFTDNFSEIISSSDPDTRPENKNIIPTRKNAEAQLAECQLLQIAKRLNDGDVDWADWEDSDQLKYVIERNEKSLRVNYYNTNYHHVSFKRHEDAEFSLEHNRKLWEQYTSFNK